jgi:hypothetical protein
MNPDGPVRKIDEQEFEELLACTVLNQQIEGYFLTKEEIAIVRTDLRQHFGLS